MEKNTEQPRWIDTLKVGDRVALVHHGYGPSNYYEAEIERETKTLLICRATGADYQIRIRKALGRTVLESYSANHWAIAEYNECEEKIVRTSHIDRIRSAKTYVDKFASARGVANASAIQLKALADAMSKAAAILMKFNVKIKK